MAYLVQYSPDAEEHLSVLPRWQQVIILDAVDDQLVHQPTVQTRNRKRMRANPIAPWELRVSDLRVYYDVDEVPEAIAHIRAVGVKVGNRVRFGREVVEL